MSEAQAWVWAIAIIVAAFAIIRLSSHHTERTKLRLIYGDPKAVVKELNQTNEENDNDE